MSAKSITEHVWTRDEKTDELFTILPNGMRSVLRRDIEALNQFRSDVRPEEADLLDVASAIFGSDRLAPRPNGFKADSLRWARHIHVHVPVRNPEFWRQSSIADRLRDVVEELTGDIWTFEFDGSFPKPTTSQLSFDPRPFPVVLFSGGLDSLAGTLDLLASDAQQGLRLVSVSSNSHIRHVQEATFDSLQQKTQKKLELFRFSIHHRRPTSDELVAQGQNLKDQARRQRARSFFYFTLASILARRTHANSIYILENGITSLNLPINPVLSSTRATRTTHPLVLLAFERLIREVLHWPEFRAELPYLLKTKAELVGPHANAHRDLISKTVSCARVLNGPWCGACTACLLRRQVLWSVGLSDLDCNEQREHSRSDIFATFETETSRRRWYFLATLDNVAQIVSKPGVVGSHPSILRTAVEWSAARNLDASVLHADLISLHNRYASEWKAVLGQVAERYDGIRRLLSHDALMSGSL